jgi:hypothetical protein
MDAPHELYLFALMTGLVVSGLASSLWAMFSDEPPQFGLLLESGFMTPVKVAVVVCCAPTMLFHMAFAWLLDRKFRSVAAVLAAAIWSFMQGVFILTQVFNLA